MLAEDNFYTPLNKQSGSPNKIGRYFASHTAAITSSWQRLFQTPFATLMTFIVIAIALALPAALFALLGNAKQVSQGWDTGSQISLYLKMDASEAQVQPLLKKLEKIPGIGKVNYISPAQGLAEFQQQTDFKDVISALPQNPLPGVVLVTPSASLDSPAAVKNLVQELQSLPEVDVAKLDLQWIKRLYAIIDLSKRLAFALGCLLGVGILFIIGNTIDLSLQRYHHEIQILKLVGATDSFVRRPFLYTGMLYGFFASLLAWLLVSSLIWSLQSPAQKIATLYGSHFQLQNLSLATGTALVLSGIILGLAGGWLAVGRRLRT